MSENLEKIIQQYYSKNHPEKEFYLNIKEDQEWQYYREFLYPNEEIQNFMGDRGVVSKLYEAGDDLSKKRRVDHWLYFATKKNMKECKIELEKDGFQVEKTRKLKNTEMPYSLQIWREDYVDLSSINPITSKLMQIAKKHPGNYDGWETFIIKE